MVRPSGKEAMLDAAEVVLTEQGAWRLTLDSVAEQAQVSKGGLLYHFPTKRALLQAMVARLMTHATARRNERRGEDADAAAILRADVETSLLDEERDLQLCAGLISALANCPHLKEPIRSFHESRFADLEALDIDQNESAVLLLAADGLMLMETLNVSPFTKEQRDALVQTMLTMAARLAEAPVS